MSGTSSGGQGNNCNADKSNFRRPSVVYEETIPVPVRRGSVTMTLRITDAEDREAEKTACGYSKKTSRFLGEDLQQRGSDEDASQEQDNKVDDCDSSCHTLRVPSVDDPPSVDVEEDFIDYRLTRSLPKARSADCAVFDWNHPRQKLPHHRLSADNGVMNPTQKPALLLPTPMRRLSMSSVGYYENFIRGRRSSYSPAHSSSCYGNISVKRRLSDQVGRP